MDESLRKALAVSQSVDQQVRGRVEVDADALRAALATTDSADSDTTPLVRSDAVPATELRCAAIWNGCRCDRRPHGWNPAQGLGSGHVWRNTLDGDFVDPTLYPRSDAVPDTERARGMTDAMILRSLDARFLDDDGDGYGGVPFVSLDEAIRALTTDRETYAARALATTDSADSDTTPLDVERPWDEATEGQVRWVRAQYPLAVARIEADARLAASTPETPEHQEGPDPV